jgi:predicted negative regulator of RcsB-dependent stress response
MDDKFHDKEKILAQYIDGELSPEAHLEVKNKLEKDIEWQEATEKLLMAMQSVRYFGMVQEVAAVHQQMMQEGSLPKIESKIKTLSIKRAIRITTAVAASLLLVFAGIKGYQFYQLSPDKVYNENFVSYQLPVTRGSNDEKSFEIKEAYQAQNYKDVIKWGRKYKAKVVEESFLIGLSYLQSNDPFSAITSLQPIVKTDTKALLKQDAEFYLALAYLKNKDYDKAIDLMQKIKADTSHPYHQQFSDKTISQVKMLKWK